MKRMPKFEVYQDAVGEFRWRLLASNKKIVAEGGEGYKTKNGAKNAVKSLQNYQLVECVVELPA